MARIFISYRREDSDIWVSRLVEELRKHFPPEQVFQDIASIDPGANFRDTLEKALGSAAVMLAVIGRGWLSAIDKQGRRRLDLPGDFVRLEVAESLRRPGVRVFPILVNGAEMPSEEDLPDPLKELHLRQAFELTVRHWHSDVAQLVQTLKRVPRPPRSARSRRGERARPKRSQEEAEAKPARGGGGRSRRVARRAAERRRLPNEEAQRRAEEKPVAKAQDEERRRGSKKKRDRRPPKKRLGARPPRRKTRARLQRKKAQPQGHRKESARKAIWKPLAVVGVVIGAIALLFLLGRRPDTESAPAPEARRAPPATESASPAPSAVTSFKAGETFRDCDQCPEMVVIPAGKFTMGSPDSEVGRSKDEGPQHTVTIARPFAVSKYEVTFDEWDACVAAGGCTHKPEDAGWGRGKRPVINVSWDDAQAYVAWLSKKTGKRYRLLSEAEWEYAARGGTTTRYPWGDEPGTNRANFDGSGSQWSGKQTAPVGSFEPNAFGLYDMIGNVWEWVQDCWNDSYQGAPADGSAWESGNCGQRVVRGGSWNNYPEDARVANRSRRGPTVRYNIQGFRLARTL